MYKYQGILDNPRGGYILLGKNGSGVFDEAIDIASKVINGNPLRSADVNIIELEEGKREITLEQISVINQSANINPFGNVHVHVIRDGERMSAAVQNQLLKVLEDGAEKNLIIICTSERLMLTVSNRCVYYFAGTLMSECELTSTADELGYPVWIIATLTQGCRDVMNNKDFLKICNLFMELSNLTASNDILFTFEALKDKDDSLIKKIDEEMLLCMLCGFNKLLEDSLLNGKYWGNPVRIFNYSKERILELQEKILNSIRLTKLRQLTVNDYFNLIRAFV
ncbi:MAG: hypothetical protein U0M91_05100 [Lachnospira eligens]|jgi:hypothetical protein